MAEELKNENIQPEEETIDLMDLFMKLWRNRKKLIIWSACGAVLGLIIAFSIPKEFTTKVDLAPELNDNKSSGKIDALASMAGLATSGGGGADAVYPMLYPDVLASVPFMTGLFDVEIETSEDPVRKMTVREYVEELEKPWWNVITSAPFKLIALLTPEEEEVGEGHTLDNFRLTKAEDKVVKALRERVTATVDSKTSVVSVSVEMQDPLVSALLADTVVYRLQEFVTDYRTNKARKDLAYAEQLNEEARVRYYEAQQEYANYLDRNQGIAFRSAQIERDRMENEVSLAFNLYNSTSQQVQRAQAKVQETTPVYAVITPATVPIKPSAPRKFLILVGLTFLAFVACAAWILFLQPMIEDYKQKRPAEEGMANLD